MFPIIVKEVRKRLNISQQDLATALGINFTTVNRWENGHVKPSKMGEKCFYEFCERHAIDLDILLHEISCEENINDK